LFASPLELYHQPEFPDYPLVCFDESCKQLAKEIRAPEAAKPGEPSREDYQYERNGTPKQGSWLNMAEIELSVLLRQCLDRRIPEQETLKSEIAAWQNRRNESANKIEWRFTTQDARIKLKHLYPAFHE
jgi:hypothetical protein